MEQRVKKKIRFRDLAPARLIVTAAALLAVGLCYLLRGNAALMARVCAKITRPYHVFMGKLCAGVPFSAAELIWAAAVVFAVVYLIVQTVLLIRRKGRWRRLWATLLTLAMLASLFWAGFSLLWSPVYYAPTFADRSGVSDGPVSAEDLAAVTKYFVARANLYAQEVERDQDGLFTADRASVLDRAAGVYGSAAALWPFLEGDSLRPKPVLCSKILSLIDFTGFFFPMTGEANLNMDSPVCLLPATAEHEISHQRGVAREQECNFLAVAACMASDDPDFRYSGALMAYIYLGNALASADPDAWREAHAALSEQVKADLAANSAYWAPYQDTAAQKTSNKVYSSFLVDNGQTLGLQSYGACVDLLVNYYKDR